MDRQKFSRFYLISMAGVVLASSYPLAMAIRVLIEMIRYGAVPAENYPKYIIPYAPISLALIAGILLLPVFNKIAKRFAFPAAAAFSTGIFFIAERLMEAKILVQTQEIIPLESWQMSLCYIPPQMYQTRTWQAVDILLGGYSPAFKIHFYLISVVLIVTFLNCFYGFARMIQTGDKTRKKALIIQAIVSVAFLGMCIWACFTAFYRTGEITVSVLSALLMAVYFILFGVTMGVFAGSFTLGKTLKLSVLLPAVISSVITLMMYIGEMILLSGNLYRFGSGVLFNGVAGIVLAPVDILIILLSGCLTAIICKAVNKSK